MTTSITTPEDLEHQRVKPLQPFKMVFPLNLDTVRNYINTETPSVAAVPIVEFTEKHAVLLAAFIRQDVPTGEGDLILTVALYAENPITAASQDIGDSYTLPTDQLGNISYLNNGAYYVGSRIERVNPETPAIIQTVRVMMSLFGTDSEAGPVDIADILATPIDATLVLVYAD
jgi:hypothetical protein